MPRSRRVLGAARVDLDRDPPQLFHQRPIADDLGGAVEVDVLVVVADLGLGRRSEDRLRQLVGLEQILAAARSRRRCRSPCIPSSPTPRGSPAPRTRPGYISSLRTRIARSSTSSGTSAEMKWLGTMSSGQLEPEFGDPVQHLPLVGNRRRHHHVVDRDPVRGDHQQVVLPLVDLADLSGGMELQIGNGWH